LNNANRRPSLCRGSFKEVFVVSAPGKMTQEIQQIIDGSNGDFEIAVYNIRNYFTEKVQGLINVYIGSFSLRYQFIREFSAVWQLYENKMRLMASKGWPCWTMGMLAMGEIFHVILLKHMFADRYPSSPLFVGLGKDNFFQMVELLPGSKKIRSSTCKKFLTWSEGFLSLPTAGSALLPGFAAHFVVEKISYPVNLELEGSDLTAAIAGKSLKDHYPTAVIYHKSVPGNRVPKDLVLTPETLFLGKPLLGVRTQEYLREHCQGMDLYVHLEGDLYPRELKVPVREGVTV
jgi:hypothetical protein